MKKKLSKLAATALSVLMCTSLLAGCSKNNDTPTDDTPANGESSVTQADNSANANSVSAGANTTPLCGGRFITGVFSTPEEGVYYTRTDVGGAYYRTPETGKWTSMNYWVTADDRGLLGIDGLAFDPQSPNKVYLLAGTEYFSNGRTAVLISDDYGENITVVDVTDKIKVHGNGMGRGNGERIPEAPTAA